MSRKSERFRGSIGWASAIALGAAGSAFARPPIVERETATPVTRITSEELAKLPTNRDLLAIFKYHNQLRAEVGSPALRWNPELAAGAAAYGSSLSQGGTLQHASREGRRTIRENLSQSPRGALSPLSMVQRWGNEQRNFRSGKFPNVTVDGNVDSILHYSQMIWPTTTDVGCAHHFDARFDWLICRYSPPGNKDGVAIGPSLPRLAQTQPGGLCTSPRGVTIPCQNAPGGVQEDGEGVVDDGGGDKDSGVKEEVVCAVDVNVHKPISVATDEPVILQEEELTKGAITLRNDDSDWRLGADGGTGDLPIISLRTDVDRGPNPHENDLVKVVGINPGLTDVYLFAFPTHAEADRELKSQVRSVNDGEHADARELAYFQAATKAGPMGLPLLIPTGATTLWVEAMLGGRYRMVIGKLVPGIAAADVRYNSKDGAAYIVKTKLPAFVCEDQATVTAAVVDLFQKNVDNGSLRLTAFDVYWGGRPHFRAEVWPGGKAFSWGERYRLGTTEHGMLGKAVDGEVASMKRDEEDAAADGNAEDDGPTVAAKGDAPGSFGIKGHIEGGFDMDHPGDPVPQVNVAVGNRYPNRVSLAYRANDDDWLVRAEYLEVLLPKVRAPVAPAGPRPGTTKKGEPSTSRASSDVQYTIVDAFDREIKAKRVDDYLYLYGAGIKAWEALDRQAGRVFESGPTMKKGELQPDDYNDFVWVMNAGTVPIRLGTAQRSQALVHDSRMLDGTFEDTLVFTAPPNENARETFWRIYTGRNGTDAAATQTLMEAARKEARDRNHSQGRGLRLTEIAQEDRRRITNSPILTIPQDVILQLRVGDVRYDLMVFGNNRLSVFAPHFFASPAFPGDKTDPVFRYHIQFAPGAASSQLVPVRHRRP